MGNYVSCTLSLHHHHIIHSKILLPDSSIRDIAAGSGGSAAAAAELMLEFPGHFVVNSRSLHVARRFNALSADEDLEPGGNIYLMFPMHRLNSLVHAADLAPLLLAAGNHVVRPSRHHSSAVPMEIKGPSMSCRSRQRPLLETIAEEREYCLLSNTWNS